MGKKHPPNKRLF